MIVFFIFSLWFESFTHSGKFYQGIIKDTILYAVCEGGLYLFDLKEEKLFKKFTSSDSLPFFPYTSLFIEENLLWIGNKEGNIALLDINKNKSIGVYPPLFIVAGKIFKISSKKDTLYISHGKGFSIIFENSPYNLEDDIVLFESGTGFVPDDSIFSFEIFRDTIYLGTNRGLYKVSKKYIYTSNPVFHQYLPEKRINHIFKYNNKLFICIDTAIYMYPDSFIKGFNFKVYKVKLQNDTIFVGTKDGVYKIYGDSSTVERISYRIPIYDFCFYQNSIIGLSDAKIHAFDKRRWGHHRYFEISYKELSSSIVSCIEKKGNSIVIGLRERGIDFFRGNIRDTNYNLGWVRTLIFGDSFIFIFRWCEGSFLFDTLFNLRDTLEHDECVQYSKYLGGDTFFVIVPVVDRIQIWNLDGIPLRTIQFEHGYLTDIEILVDSNLIVSNTFGKVFVVDKKTFEKRTVLFLNFPIFDICVTEREVFLATSDGLYLFSYPEFTFIKKYSFSDPFTISVTKDKYGRVYALTRSGFLVIETNRDIYTLYLPGPGSVFYTGDLEPSNHCSAQLLHYSEKEDKIYIGTMHGISIYKVNPIPYHEEKKVIIYPNPYRKGDNGPYIILDENIKKIYLYSISGKKKRLSIIGNKLLIEDLPTGFYIIYIETDKNKYFEKFIYEK